MDLSYFQKINNAYSTNNLRDVDLYEIKQEISDSFEDTVDYQIVTKRDNTKQGLLIVKQKNLNKKSIKAKPSESFNLGDDFKWNNLDWLVIEKDSDSKIYDTGTIQQCNYTLPFQLNTSDIIQEPCIISDNQTTVGQDQNKIITVPDTLKHILIQYNSNTVQLQKGKRIFIDKQVENPSVYEVTKIDRITHMVGEHGLLELTCEEGQVTEKDRSDLLIADYISPVSPAPPVSDLCEITYSGSPEIKVGSSKTFMAVFKDESGNVLTDVTPIWNVIAPGGYESYVSFSENGMTITITIANHSEMIGQHATIKLSSVDNSDGVTLDFKVVSLI